MSKEKEPERRIVQGVQMPEQATEGRRGGVSLRTYVPGDEDELEARLTAEQVEYLTEQGAIEGDWTPGAKAAPKKGKGKAKAGDDYDGWSREDLQHEAGVRAIEGRSGMNKEELIQALRDSDK